MRKGTKVGYATAQEWDDVQGWVYKCFSYRKHINGKEFVIRKNEIDRTWDTYIHFQENEVYAFSRPTMHKCKVLAHDTARLWAG